MDQTVTCNPLQQLLRQRAHGAVRGLYSCCSANAFVLRAAMRRAKATGTIALIEATANQVNQDGGYTGMTPEQFRAFVLRIAAEEGLPLDRVFCGGDHLGPLTWRHLPETEAMEQAKTLVDRYAAAGFSKIHIDTSMRLADDDPNQRLPDATIARRGALLCKEAERAARRYRAAHPAAPMPVYVIGSEVPIPGGAMENEDSVAVTSPEDCQATLEAFRTAFAAEGLTDAWNRVVALVVQPGVEFADESVITYSRPAAAGLTALLQTHDGLVFEGHSTDYQPRERLREMVQDGIAILKVGPALTFALREGLFALSCIERELALRESFRPTALRETLEQVMLESPRYWAPYYTGSEAQQAYARAYSYSDRVRYYLPDARVDAAIHTLLGNLDQTGLPPALLSQYLPRQYARVQAGQLQPKAADVLIDRIGDRIDDYLFAILP